MSTTKFLSFIMRAQARTIYSLLSPLALRIGVALGAHNAAASSFRRGQESSPQALARRRALRRRKLDFSPPVAPT
jgi:hypothetical protein